MFGLDTTDWAALIGGVVAIANVVTAATPTRADNKILGGLLRVLNVAALNVGKNRNADDV